MKKIKRSEKFEIQVVLNSENFIRPPKNAQRNIVLNRALKEFSEDLMALDVQTHNFVPGNTVTDLKDRQQGVLAEQEIMEDWQIPLMQKMADLIAHEGGDILEIGFGRGVSADMIQKYPVKSHTMIECNDAVVEQFYKWKEKYPSKDIRLVHGLWQETIDDLGLFDGIFFHTYVLNEDEYMRYVNGSVTFAEHFFEDASKHLQKGGAFTYFSNEVDSLSREHQRLLLRYFSSFNVQTVSLEMPLDVKDTWWADKIVAVKAIK